MSFYKGKKHSEEELKTLQEKVRAASHAAQLASRAVQVASQAELLEGRPDWDTAVILVSRAAAILKNCSTAIGMKKSD